MLFLSEYQIGDQICSEGTKLTVGEITGITFNGQDYEYYIAGRWFYKWQIRLLSDARNDPKSLFYLLHIDHDN